MLLSAAVFLLVIVFVFSIILPLNHSIRLSSIAVKNQKAILNYVLKYSYKINSIKSKAAISAGNSSASVASGKTGGSAESKSEGKGYIKFISSLFKYFKINKTQISKLYSRYSSAVKDAKTGAGGSNGAGGVTAKRSKEAILISLKGLSLDQCVNLIYAVSHSSGEYGADIISIKMKKNFTNAKLLNLTINIVRH
ncbi:MAG: hypothetical protein M0034_06310 [Deltaproteobacteria bacterium]|nr:hypothetical protein [Deltaproteobacteria bacterium]